MVFDRDDDILCDDTIYYLYPLPPAPPAGEIADGALGACKTFLHQKVPRKKSSSLREEKKDFIFCVRKYKVVKNTV